MLNVEHPDGTVESWKCLPKGFVTEYTDQADLVSKYKYHTHSQIIELAKRWHHQHG